MLNTAQELLRRYFIREDNGNNRPVKTNQSGPRINERIRVPEIRLIGDDGEQYGVVSIEEARRIAQGAGLDLVEVSPNAKPPVVKLIDFGKYKYQAQKKANEAKKKQVVISVKEIKLRPSIDTHDLQVKLKKVNEFLEDGDKVKLLMQFRGREMAHIEIGLEKFTQIIQKIVAEFGAVVESEAKRMGNKVQAMVAPSKKQK